LQKQHKLPSWGLGSWDPAAKVHMMTHEKQETLQRCKTRKQFFRRGDEEALPHAYNINYESEMYAIVHPNQLQHPHYSRLGI
jgi:hypothetical protein